MISTMDTLPDPALQGAISNQPSAISNTGQASVGSASKEIEGGVGLGELGLRDVSGQEIEVPKEVASAGVTVHPTTIAIPQPVQQLGVKPTGANIPAQAAAAVALPLTDDQIATGLHQSIASSIRWLAEWCLRRLKQLHMGIKYIHGKVMRVKS